MRHPLKTFGALAAALFLAFGHAASAVGVDPALPDYKKADGIAGHLSSVGSDTLANLMAMWAEAFKRIYPTVSIDIEAAGSSTAPPALASGASSFGPMSRMMKKDEEALFEGTFGYKPTAVPVAIDTLAVYVHRDNPIAGLSMQQVDAIFSSTRSCGLNRDILGWGDLGLSGAWSNRRIELFGRNAISGTYGYFREKALCKGEYKTTVQEQPGSAAVVQSVAGAPGGIGYSGIGYMTSGVRAVPLAKGGGSRYVEPNYDTALSGDYPLARFLYIYVNKHPNQPLPPLERELIKLILSKTGQEIVLQDGYLPLPAKQAARIAGQLE